jgi:phosphoglycerol transferase
MKKKIFVKVIAYVVCFLAALLILTTLWMNDKFGMFTIDSILFHLNHPLDKTPAAYPLSYLKRVLIAVLFVSAWACCFRLRLFGESRHLKTALLAFPFFLLPGAILFAAVSFSVPEYLMTRTLENKVIEAYYRQVDIDGIKFPEKKRNVVVLVVESLEMNLNDRNMFPEPLIPGLADFRERGFSCNLNEAPGMNWTVGSFTGLLFGLPLRLPITGNDYRSVDDLFLPGAISLLEIFEANGYSVNLIAGNDTDFAGVNNIFINHLKSPGIYDLDYFKSLGMPEESSWGIRDKHLYEGTRQLITQLILVSFQVETNYDIFVE